MTVEALPVEGLPIVRPGDDLAAMLVEPLRALGARSGDVVVVTQKIVSKAEGRVVPDDDRAAWVERETERVVARRTSRTAASRSSRTIPTGRRNGSERRSRPRSASTASAWWSPTRSAAPGERAS